MCVPLTPLRRPTFDCAAVANAPLGFPSCDVRSVVPVVVRRCAEDTTICGDEGEEHYIPKGSHVYLMIKARLFFNLTASAKTTLY